MSAIFFYTFASLAVVMVLMMILQKNPVSSALCLIVSFFGLAGLYVMLEAHFVAVLQILVYAGAIMVLFVFIIMLLNLSKEDLVVQRLKAPQFLGVILGVGVCLFLAVRFMDIPRVGFVEPSKDFGTAEAIGRLMFSEYVIPFEVIGLLLLVGIVGAVLLGRKEE